MQHAVERLQAAAADRRGSAEEITALFVALLRSHSLAVRFVRCDAVATSFMQNLARAGQHWHAELTSPSLMWCVRRS